MNPIEAQLDEHGNRLPPGTFLLIKQNGAVQRNERIVLEPHPGSDPNNPLNWSHSRKAYNLGLVLANTVVIFTVLSIQINFWQLMGPDMGVTISQLNNAVSINYVGLSLGCFFFIPFSTKYGRRSTYVLSAAVMAMSSWWSAKMHTVAELYLTNLIAGLAGATNETIALMTIADLFFVHQRGTMNALYLTAVMIGSFLTVVPAGVQAVNQGWRTSYLTLAAFNTALFVLFLVSYEETKYTAIVEGLSPQTSANIEDSALHQKQNDGEMAITPGTFSETSAEANGLDAFSEQPVFYIDDDYIDRTIPLRRPRERLQWSTPTDESLWRLAYTPILVLIKFPHVIYTAFQWSGGVVWLTLISTIISIVFSEAPYNFNAAQLGYLSISAMIGSLLGAAYSGVLGDHAIVWLSRRNKGYFEPEFRLYTLIPSIITQSLGLILFGYFLQQGAHWVYPSIGGLLFGFGLGSISDASLTLVIDCYIELTGPSFVAVAFVRNAISIAVPFTITSWMEVMNLQNMFILSGMISLVVSAPAILLVIFGKRIRVALAQRYYALVERQAKL